jgi:hypothetical protein
MQQRQPLCRPPAVILQGILMPALGAKFVARRYADAVTQQVEKTAPALPSGDEDPS